MQILHQGHRRRVGGRRHTGVAGGSQKARHGYHNELLLQTQTAGRIVG